MDFKLQETTLKKIDGVFFKLEYENPTGSVKDRGIPLQIEDAVKKGYKKFVISSSGNAAISALYWTAKIGAQLIIFASPGISKGKLDKLKSHGADVQLTEKPISSAFRYSKNNNAFFLRASTDPTGYLGYKDLAKEIRSQLPDVGSIFVPVSSGTLCYGLAKGFDETVSVPQIHAVQTTSCNFIAAKFDKDFVTSKKSLADALVAKTSVLKARLIYVINDSGGSGWVVNDEQISSAWEYLSENNIKTSYEGAAALAALWKAKQKHYKLREPSVVLLTGKYYERD